MPRFQLLHRNSLIHTTREAISSCTNSLGRVVGHAPGMQRAAGQQSPRQVENCRHTETALGGGDEATGSSRQIKSLPGRWNAAFQLCGTHARWLPRPSHILLLVHAASSKYSILMLQLKWAHDRTEANGSDDSSNKTLHFHRASMRVCLPHSSALEWCSHLSAFAPASCAP